MAKRMPAILGCVLLVICLGQGYYIARSELLRHRELTRDLTRTIDPQGLLGSLKMPDGARGKGARIPQVNLGEARHDTQANGEYYSFTGMLYLDTSDMAFKGRREVQVAEVAWHFAKQIEKRIPGANIESHSASPGMAGVGGLAATVVVRHPRGWVVVAAAFEYSLGGTSVREGNEVANAMKVNFFGCEWVNR